MYIITILLLVDNSSTSLSSDAIKIFNPVNKSHVNCFNCKSYGSGNKGAEYQKTGLQT